MDVEQAELQTYTTQLQTYTSFYGKRMTQKEVSRPQRAEPRAVENHSQGGSSGP